MGRPPRSVPFRAGGLCQRLRGACSPACASTGARLRAGEMLRCAVLPRGVLPLGLRPVSLDLRLRGSGALNASRYKGNVRAKSR